MLRQATLRQEDTLLHGQDPVRPVLAHLYGRMDAGTDLIVMTVPPDLGLRPDDDYSIEVTSFRGCFDPAHKHDSEAAVVDADDSQSAFLPGPKNPHIFQLDGNDDGNDDDDDESQSAVKRVRRAPRARGSVVRVSLQWNFTRPPSRKIEAAALDFLTPAILIKKINVCLRSIFETEFMGLAFGQTAPEVFFMEEGSRCVILLPPAAILTFAAGGSTVWKMLGFTNLDSPLSPFHKAKAGDYALVNFSPFRARMFVSDVSVLAEQPFVSEPQGGFSTNQKKFWETASRMVTHTASVTLSRVNSTGITEFDLSADTTLLSSGAASPRPLPPFAASKALETILAASIKAFGIGDLRLPDLGDPDQVEEVGFSVPLNNYPQLEITKLSPTLPTGGLVVTLSAGPDAANLLGFHPGVLNTSFDAGKGHLSTLNPSYLLSDDPSPTEWKPELHGDLATALALTRLVVSVRARDVSYADETVQRTSRGLLSEFRKAAYKIASRTEAVSSAMPADLMEAAAQSDTTEADFEYALSEFLLLQPKKTPRFWHVTYQLDETKRVLPVIPHDWKSFVPPPPLTPPKEPEVSQEQPGEEAGDSDIDPVPEQAAEGQGGGGGGGEEAEEQKQGGEVDEEIPTQADVDESAATVGGDVPFAAAVDVDVDVVQEQDPVDPDDQPPSFEWQKYDCLLAGQTPFSSRSKRRLCPAKKDDQTPTTFPAVFHVTLEEGDKTEFLGPLGLCSYVGTFRGSSGDAVTLHKAVLRGGGQISRLTFRAVDVGYDPFVPKHAGIVFVICSFHPHRPKELPAAAAAAAGISSFRR